MSEGIGAGSGPLWRLDVLRAILAGALAIIVTFTPNHSPALGLLLFGGWAALQGGVLVPARRSGAPTAAGRALTGVQGVTGVVLGVGAVLWGAIAPTLPLLLLLVTAFAAITGALELFLGWRAADRSAGSRDRRAVGGITVALAVVFLVIPPDAVLAVGLLGAYAAVLAVYLGIAGLSLKWQFTPPGRVARNGGK